jgi:thiol-disulfide isomerase/thioredoxin
MFNRRRVIQLVPALAAAGVAAHAWAQGALAPLPEVGSTLRLPVLKLLDGRTWNPAAVRGKTLVVYWWASWCPFCSVQSPHIEALWQAHKASGLEVLALSIDRKPGAAEAYMKTRGYTFPAALLQEDTKFLHKPRGLPVVVVLKVNGRDGRSGKVMFAEAGEMFPDDVEGLKKYL